MKRVIRRSLLVEGLEARQCFSSDVGALFTSPVLPPKVAEILRHNYEQPTDVNVDGHTSPADALNIINELNAKTSMIDSAMKSDTNGDRVVSPLDALVVINYLNSRPGASQDLSEKARWDDNGDDYFLSAEDAKLLSTAIEAELRRQLKLDDAVSIQVAVFTVGDEIRSGTWVYLTEEGIKIWGNWRQSADELRLFLSNVEEENRFYGQYPGGSLVFFSWLDKQPVNFFFTPIDKPVVENPVPIERYTSYFRLMNGVQATRLEDGKIYAFSGDFDVFDGVLPMTQLLGDLFAIQRT